MELQTVAFKLRTCPLVFSMEPEIHRLLKLGLQFKYS